LEFMYETVKQQSQQWQKGVGLDDGYIYQPE